MRPQQKILYIVRHGEVDNPDGKVYGRERDVPLSDAGTEQIRRLAQAVVSLGEVPQYAYVSPLRRTRETAAILAEVWGEIPLEYRDELLETDSRGYAGRPLVWARSLGDPYRKPAKDYEIEDPALIAERMRVVADEALGRGDLSVSVIVSHGDPIAFLVDALLHPGKPLRSIIALRNDTFLQKGQAWRIVCDMHGNVVSRSVVSGLMKPKEPDFV